LTQLTKKTGRTVHFRNDAMAMEWRYVLGKEDALYCTG
jgi:hypothetical protein